MCLHFCIFQRFPHWKIFETQIKKYVLILIVLFFLFSWPDDSKSEDCFLDVRCPSIIHGCTTAAIVKLSMDKNLVVHRAVEKSGKLNQAFLLFCQKKCKSNKTFLYFFAIFFWQKMKKMIKIIAKKNLLNLRYFQKTRQIIYKHSKKFAKKVIWRVFWKYLALRKTSCGNSNIYIILGYDSTNR